MRSVGWAVYIDCIDVRILLRLLRGCPVRATSDSAKTGSVRLPVSYFFFTPVYSSTVLLLIVVIVFVLSPTCV